MKKTIDLLKNSVEQNGKGWVGFDWNCHYETVKGAIMASLLEEIPDYDFRWKVIWNNAHTEILHNTLLGPEYPDWAGAKLNFLDGHAIALDFAPTIELLAAQLYVVYALDAWNSLYDVEGSDESVDILFDSLISYITSQEGKIFYKDYYQLTGELPDVQTVQQQFAATITNQEVPLMIN